jgi:hypothetical protein
MVLAELSYSGSPGIPRSEQNAIQHSALALLHGDPRGLRMITYILEHADGVRPEILRPLKRASREILGRARKAR